MAMKSKQQVEREMAEKAAQLTEEQKDAVVNAGTILMRLTLIPAAVMVVVVLIQAYVMLNPQLDVDYLKYYTALTVVSLAAMVFLLVAWAVTKVKCPAYTERFYRYLAKLRKQK